MKMVTVNGEAGKNCLPNLEQNLANLCQLALYLIREVADRLRKDLLAERFTKAASSLLAALDKPRAWDADA